MYLKLRIYRIVGNTEVLFYFFIWVSAVLYSLYRFSLTAYRYFQYYVDRYDDFEKGLSFLASKRDKADYEWEAVLYFLSHIYPWCILHLFIREISFYYNLPIKLHQLWRISFTCLFILSRNRLLHLLFVLFQPTVFCCVHYLYKEKKAIWISSALSIMLITVLKNYITIQENDDVNGYEVFLMFLCLSWINLRCTSFFLEEKMPQVLNLFSYCLYFPTLFTGPFILYEGFQEGYNHCKYPPTYIRVLNYLKNVSFTLFWVVFEYFWLHYIYVNAATFHPSKLVHNLDTWAFYGFGYAMGQHFHVKYIVIYGLSTSAASFENIPVPRLPRCIARIHLYSDMWKYFDAGLYKFLVRHIYLPALRLTSHKLIASMLTFAYVFIWHGIEKYVFIWCLLNFVGIAIEHICAVLYNKAFLSDKSINLNHKWMRRIKCILCAFLLSMSAVSNFYFFGGIEIGNLFFIRLFTDSFLNTTILIFILYCSCQVAMELHDVHSRKCD